MIIRFFGGFAFQLLYIQSTEIIPTTMRQLGVGSCTVAIRVGSVIAPFIREFSEWTHPAASMAMFGALMTFDAMLICLLPETKGVEIPDTLQEAAKIGNKQNETTEC
ncbi:organic cation transporter protein-like protein [Leptotrombidium deliense]|uniref:Organic cation transporter protein-like protein n=1 Tax=Leptotrombidium deliense TaxID=299467 RepID=A0A443RTI8_9ACAR|nr:organic cation transporter protein-like protein [Leptotrombidium deliense]